MESLGFAAFAVAFLGVFWWLSRLMNASKRNDDASHGGGYNGMSAGL